MSTHRWCCCGANPENPCADSCDWSTSYVLSGFTGTHSFNREWRADPCGECSNNDGPNNMRSIGFTASFAQQSATTLTRYTQEGGTTCCYQAQGVMNVSWTLSIVDRYYLCPDFNGICEHTESKMGTEETDFCITAVCRQNPLTGQTGWLWTLTTCSFPLALVELIDASNLQQGYSCEDEPPLAAPIGIVAGGAMWSWWTPLVNPSTLSSLDAISLGGCVQSQVQCGPEFSGTDPQNLNTACMYTMEQMSVTYGPCTLVSVSQASFPTAPCAITVPSGFDPGSYFGCGNQLLFGACPGNIDYADACCEVNLSHGWSFGLII